MLNYKKEMNIESICQEYDIQNYTINSDGTVDVDGIVDLSRRNLSKLHLKFGRVTGNFYCYNNKLTTLEGCPKVVGGEFYCYDNPLPQEIIDNPKSFLKHRYRDILINELIDEY